MSPLPRCQEAHSGRAWGAASVRGTAGHPASWERSFLSCRTGGELEVRGSLLCMGALAP